jgi:DNA polymerase IV
MTSLKGHSKFIHCDCDCFFAAIEIRDDPALRNLPVAVGGDEKSRGVIATCNYVARSYGVRSAMASSTARRLCRDLIIIPPNIEKYRIASAQILRIYTDYTNLVEPLSLDEAFLDISQSTVLHGSGQLIAQDIRRRVKQEIGITLSAGIAPNKFLAKIASDWNKPDGQYAITPDEVPAFMRNLSVNLVHGVGKITARKMQLLGIETCGDLQGYSKLDLLQQFGSFGDRLYALCRGEDNRPISNDQQPRSLSVEETYPNDLMSVEQCLAELPALFDELQRRINRQGLGRLISKQFVKLKFSNFVSTSVEQLAMSPTLDGYRGLCQIGHNRGNKLPVRLLGLGVRLKTPGDFHQIELPL